MFLGENLPSWLILAVGAALAVGNALALISPRPVDVGSDQDPDVDGDQDSDESTDLERPPLGRSLFMIALGSAAAVWALASLIAG